jgi:hypothetical protein
LLWDEVALNSHLDKVVSNEAATSLSLTRGALRNAPALYQHPLPVDPRDVPAEKAARRLHPMPADFQAKLPELMVRGFPRPDPTTGMFDLTAIDEWMTAVTAPQLAP